MNEELLPVDQRREDQYPSRDARVWQDSLEKVRTVSNSPYTVTSDDDILLIDSTSNAIIVNLPDAIMRRKLTIINVAGTNTVTITPVGTDTINGASDHMLVGLYFPIQIKAVDNGWVATAIVPTISSLLPDQTGNSGEFLTTNGTIASWTEIPDQLPDQTGNSGEFLTTDGTIASWAEIPDTWQSVRAKVYFFAGF